ncbi:MAG: hypothetical protein H0W09_02780 [Solirubrobacterales bacterium]|nr:hypothetical protein [Solirubrobacterales bacterium]
MEASRRPQLELGSEGGATVRALDGRLVIESLTVDDERAARLVRERAQAGRPAAETVRKAIEIGSRVLEGEGTAANVDYVRRELEAGLGELDRKLGGTLEAGAESLAERISIAFGAERNDSVQAQIREIVTAEARLQRESLLGTLTSEDAANPLVAMQARIGKGVREAEERHRLEIEKLRRGHGEDAKSMRDVVAGLRQEVARLLEREQGDERLAEAEQAGTRKGRTFEEKVHSALERIATGRGDVAHHVGDERGQGGSKKGDTLVELGAADGPARGRIVFEDKADQLSKNKAWEELNGALLERNADFSVLVVAGDGAIPSGREQLHEYEGNKLIVAVDPEDPDDVGLELAYRYARCRTLMSRARSLEVDASGVRDAAEAARGALKRANAIRLSLTSIDKSAAKAREGVDAIVADVEAELTKVESLVAEAAEAEAPGPS